MPIISMIRQIEGVLIFVIPIDNPTVPIAEANSKSSFYNPIPAEIS